MKLLITGGTGFLGRHLVAAAKNAGHQITVMSRQASEATGLPEDVVTVNGMIREGVDLTEAIATAHPDAVIHTAAVVDDNSSELLPVNVGGTAALVAAMEAASPNPRLVYVSSFAVEDTPPTAYSRSKEQAESLVASSSLPYVLMRPSLIYGPGDTSNGPRLVQSLRSGIQWLPGGGSVKIQPVHVADVAKALITAAESDAPLGKTYRLGGPEPISVASYRGAVRDIAGGSARLLPMPRPLLGIAARIAAILGRPRGLSVLAFHRQDHLVDSSEAIKDLGFAPRPLQDGLEETYSAEGPSG